MGAPPPVSPLTICQNVSLGGIIPHITQNNFWEKNVPLPKGKVDIFITMEIVVSEKQIINFLRRRFSSEDLLWIVNDVQEMIDEGGECGHCGI